MFRNRKNSQKPLDEFYAAFKLAHPDVGPGTVAVTSAAPIQNAVTTSAPLSDPIMDHRHLEEHGENKDFDKTPKDANDPWRFTPSILDTNSIAFNSIVNQPPGYYTPTPGGTSTAYHNQAGDLHTPRMNFQLGTPLSLPTSESQIHPAAAVHLHNFHSHLLNSQQFQTPQNFSLQQSYAPSSFVHHNQSFGAVGAPGRGPVVQEIKRETEAIGSSGLLAFPPGAFDASMPAPPVPLLEKFRYQVRLRAPTAMIRHAAEIPVTYLNKGQAYALSIVDSMRSQPSSVLLKYRTVIRISFEDEQQRQRPSACWQLWKEGRGLAESHLRGGKLQAVEYVDPNHGEEDEGQRPRVELERASFDSFSVIWSLAPGSAPAECSIAVRFNFLSTDFSHSKGVKGIPVRLCAKTEIVSSSTPDSPPGSVPEVCFCKVKLFRDHGAERKLSNDVAHIKKTIDKLKQQITQVESGTNEFGKRKRSGSIASKNAGGSRPSKIPKHKRTWSVSSQGSASRPAPEDDLHMKLASIQAMFTSTRPVSILYLRGYEQDDPDKYPVSLPGEPQVVSKRPSGNRKASWDVRGSAETTPTNSCLVSPTPSSASVRSQAQVNEKLDFQPSNVFDNTLVTATEWDHFTHFSSASFEPPNAQSTTDFSGHVVKIPRDQSGESLPDWIEALGVDPLYHAPPERPIKPVACFYILIQIAGDLSGHDYYRAVYLMTRTVKDLTAGIAAKCTVDATRIARILRVNSRGLKIMVDDETVRELPEGQDMKVEFSDIEDSTESGSGCGDISALRPVELRLLY